MALAAAAADSGDDAAPVAFGNGARAPLGNGAAAATACCPATPVGGSDALPLPPEQAFGFEAIAGDGNTLLLRFTPARGYYLYRDKTSLRLDPRAGKAGIALGQPQLAARHRAPRRALRRRQRLLRPDRRAGAAAAHARPTRPTCTLTAGFQGCQTDGICYPPMTRTVTWRCRPAAWIRPPSPRSGLCGARSGASAATDAGADAGAADALDGNVATAADGGRATATGAAAAADAAPAEATAPLQAEDSRLADALPGPNRWWALLSFFGFGLLLAFTPCVLPMIPILSGLIAGHGPGLGARRAFALSFVYVLANAWCSPSPASSPGWSAPTCRSRSRRRG